MKFSMPLFTMGQFLACFIRNDNAPAKAMAAVITGGVFNIGGDYFFVFVCDMGVEGAGAGDGARPGTGDTHSLFALFL